MNKVDFNNVTFSGSNSGMSSLLQLRGGTLTFASDTAAGSGDLEVHQATQGTTTAVFTSSAPIIGSLSGDGSTQVSLNLGAAHSLTINQSSDNKYDGVISGTGGLIKAGSATLELTGNSNYSGTTSVNAGVLKASSNSAFGSGSLLLNGGTINVASGSTIANALVVAGSGGTLTGSGTFASAVTVANNTFISPGDGVGSMTFGGGLTLGQQGTYNFEIKSATGSAGSGYDSISVTGALAFTSTLGSPFHLNLTTISANGSPGALADFNSSTAYTWLLATATGGISGFNPASISIDASQFSNGLGTGNFSVSTSGNSLYLNFVAVPEPATWALLLSGASVVCWMSRRRKRN